MDGGPAKVGARTAAILVGVLTAFAAKAGMLASPGCLDGGTAAVVTGVEPELDLRTMDGRHVRLAGIDVASVVAGEARDRLSGWLVGKAVRVAPLGLATDRWGRVPALVFAPNDPGAETPSVSVGEALLEAGLARARPNEAVASCWAAYLRLEADARDARRGLWSGSASGVIAADDETELRAHVGSFVVVEGAVASLRDGRFRTYLRFTDGQTGGFAVSFDRRATLRLGKAGLNPPAWLHRKLRVRGFLDDRWGLQIEVSGPQQVEVLGP